MGASLAAIIMVSLRLTSPTGRIVLLPPTPAEDEAVAALRSHPVVRKFLQFLPESTSVEDIRKRREGRASDPAIFDLLAFLRSDDGVLELAGSTGVFHMDTTQRSCEAGIIIAPKFHGQNLTAEILYTLFHYIFEEKQFHRISLETSSENAPMRGWLEKVAGMRLEGIRKEWWTDNAGGWLDVCGYAVLEREWKGWMKQRLLERVNGTKTTSSSPTRS